MQYHQFCRLSLEYIFSNTGWLRTVGWSKEERRAPLPCTHPLRKLQAVVFYGCLRGGVEVHQDKYLKTASAKTEVFVALSTSAGPGGRGRVEILDTKIIEEFEVLTVEFVSIW